MKAAKNVAFGSAASIIAQQGLNFLDTNQAWGANFVDLAFMVTPRTAVDFTRGPEAGAETLRREASGTTNHSLIGLYGLGAAALMAAPLNKKFGVKVQDLFASNNTIHILGQNWDEQLKGGNVDRTLEGYLQKTFENVQGFNPTHKSQVNGYVGLPAETQQEAVKKFAQEIKQAVDAEKSGNKSVKLGADAKKYLKTLIGSSVESENQFKIQSGEVKEVLSLDTLIDNVYKLSKTFMKEKVGTEFAKVSSFADNAFIKGLKHLNTRTSLLGLGIATAIGCSIQPFNMYLTKKKTGKDGFVGGGEDRKPDHSAKFKLMKTGMVAGFGAMVLATIGTMNPKKLLSKIQFQGFTPTINQFKAIYGMTIMSRFVVARDKDELREASTKDTLGFLNWMVLGGFVKSIAAMGFEKYAKLGDFLKYSDAEHGKGLWNKLTKASIITRTEVLYEALKKEGIATIKDGKALGIKEMMKALPKGHPALKKIKLLSAAQFLSYAYSGLILGVGIPKLNIAITKNLDKKRKAKKAAEAAKNPVNTANASNAAFLQQKNQKTAFAEFAK